MTIIQCESLNAALDHAAISKDSQRPSYVFRDVSNWPEQSDEDLKIDLAMYPKTQRVAKATQLAEDEIKKVKDPRKGNAARVTWAWMTVGLEVKRDNDRSAFYFSNTATKGLLRDTAHGREGQAQIAKYATQLMLRQHRTYVFIIYILKDMVRLTRWDRTGCIVSSPVKFTKEPGQLLNFVYRLALMSDDELGYDTTATLATEAELKELETIAAKLKNSYARMRAEEILNKDTQIFYPIYKVTCPDITGDGHGEYFIGKHRVASYSPTGRATRGYITFIRKTARLGFMKDYWRPNSVKIHTELAAYKKLQEKGARHVATAISGGDVASQRTVTQSFLKDEKVPLEHAHCRLVLKELARPMADCKNSSEMIGIVYHALQGHKDGWEKAELLHRDVSVENMMNVVDQESEGDFKINGILNDWDLCKRRDELNGEATQHGRSGTWAFMSSVSLQYPLKPYELADDLEAFVHALIYCCLRYHRHSMTPQDIGPSLDNEQLVKINGSNIKLGTYVANYFYDSWDNGTGIESGGTYKKLYIERGSPDFVFDNSVSPVLVELINRLYRLLRKHYAVIDFEELKKYMPKRKILPLPAQSQPSPIATEDEEQQELDLDIGSDGEADDTDDTTASETSRPHTLVKRGQRVLDTHRKILRVFRDAATAIKKDSRNLPLDKTKDQFLGLIEFSGREPARSTKRVSTSTNLSPEDPSDKSSKKSRLGWGL